MGVDLSLYPVASLSEYGCTSFSCLWLERRRELWPLIESLPKDRVPGATGSFGDSFQTIQTDPYGSPLACVRAGDLVTLASRSQVQDNEINRASWAYLAELDPDRKILLYWH